MRYVLLIAFTAFGITLAIIIGLRLSQEALAVLIGAAIGVAATLPSTLLLVWLVNRPQPIAPPPSITIIPPPTSIPPTAAPTLPAPAKRQFVIIGGDELIEA